MNENWYAVYTKPRWEKKVAETLTTHGVCNYCPLNKVVKQWSDRKKIIQEPLFTSYVFVRISESQISSLKKVDGIINLVTWLDKPAVIREAEIAVIRQFLNEYSQVKLEKANLHVNDPVKITNGPMVEQQGTVVEMKKQTVKVALPSLGFMLYVELEKSNIQTLA